MRRDILPFALATLLAGLCLAPLLGRAADAIPYQVLEPLGPVGRIAGIVIFTGKAPAPRPYLINEKTELCGTERDVPAVRTQGGGLGDVVVALKAIEAGKAHGPAPEIKREGCEYHPRVMGMMAGQRLTLRNLDPASHVVMGEIPAERRTVFGFLQPVQGSKNRKLIEEPGLIRIYGESEPWAFSWLYVATHPYFSVTAADGTFALENVPPGTYTLVTWHAALGTRSEEIEIKPSTLTQVTFTYQGTASSK